MGTHYYESCMQLRAERAPGATIAKKRASFRTSSNMIIIIIIIYINSISLLVCDGGFGGWGKERPVKQRATGVSL